MSNAGDEPYIPADLLQSQDSIEAWIAVYGHRHLIRMGDALAKYSIIHAKLHILKSITPEEEWESAHAEVMDDMDELTCWVERGKTAIWN